MKKLICAEFCNSLSVTELPNGYGISTAYTQQNGDPIGFYAIGPDENGNFRLLDGGAVVPMLEATGATLESQTRRSLFDALLAEFGAQFDADGMDLARLDVPEAELPSAALAFLGLMLRIQDLSYLTIERVESTFKEDVIRALRVEIGERAIIREEEPVSDALSEEVPDVVIEARGRSPVALFIITNAARLYQAIQLQMIAQYEVRTDLRVAAMLEHDGSVPSALRQKADNRLDAVPRYLKGERDAIHRIVREAVGASPLN